MSQCEIAEIQVLGQLAFHANLPGAIRCLEDDELRALLLALLTEWRGRTAEP